MRYDISYLVIRADLGIGIHTPYPNPDKTGYYNISSFKDGLGFHLGDRLSVLRGGAYGYGEGGWVFSAALAHTSLPSYRERISRRMNIE